MSTVDSRMMQIIKTIHTRAKTELDGSSNASHTSARICCRHGLANSV